MDFDKIETRPSSPVQEEFGKCLQEIYKVKISSPDKNNQSLLVELPPKLASTKFDTGNGSPKSNGIGIQASFEKQSQQGASAPTPIKPNANSFGEFLQFYQKYDPYSPPNVHNFSQRPIGRINFPIDGIFNLASLQQRRSNPPNSFYVQPSNFPRFVGQSRNLQMPGPRPMRYRLIPSFPTISRRLPLVPLELVFNMKITKRQLLMIWLKPLKTYECGKEELIGKNSDRLEENLMTEFEEIDKLLNLCCWPRDEIVGIGDNLQTKPRNETLPDPVPTPIPIYSLDVDKIKKIWLNRTNSTRTTPAKVSPQYQEESSYSFPPDNCKVTTSVSTTEQTEIKLKDETEDKKKSELNQLDFEAEEEAELEKARNSILFKTLFCQEEDNDKEIHVPVLTED